MIFSCQFETGTADKFIRFELLGGRSMMKLVLELAAQNRFRYFNMLIYNNNIDRIISNIPDMYIQ